MMYSVQMWHHQYVLWRLEWGKLWYTLALGDHPIPFYPCQGLVAMQRGSANKIMQICRHIFAEPSMDSWREQYIRTVMWSSELCNFSDAVYTRCFRLLMIITCIQPFDAGYGEREKILHFSCELAEHLFLFLWGWQQPANYSSRFFIGFFFCVNHCVMDSFCYSKSLHLVSVHRCMKWRVWSRTVHVQMHWKSGKEMVASWLSATRCWEICRRDHVAGTRSRRPSSTRHWLILVSHVFRCFLRTVPVFCRGRRSRKWVNGPGLPWMHKCAFLLHYNWRGRSKLTSWGPYEMH